MIVRIHCLIAFILNFLYVFLTSSTACTTLQRYPEQPENNKQLFLIFLESHHLLVPHGLSEIYGSAVGKTIRTMAPALNCCCDAQSCIRVCFIVL